MSITIHLTKPRDPKSRAEQAIELLRANGFDDFADELYGPHQSECGSISLWNISVSDGLVKQAKASGVYRALFRPESCGMTRAGWIVNDLIDGLRWLESNQEEDAEPSTYAYSSAGELRKILRAYIAACEDFPEADIEVSR